MSKFILLNGPPRSGKDTAAKLLINILANAERSAIEDKLSAPLKRGFAGVVDTPMEGFNVLGFEDHKELPIAQFGVSYRQFQIDMSEKFMKPLYGKDIFAKLLIARASNHRCEYTIVSDCGFQHEVDYLTQHAECYVIQLRREGCTFDGDSREYVGHPNGGAYTISNNGTIEQLLGALSGAVLNLNILGK